MQGHLATHCRRARRRETAAKVYAATTLPFSYACPFHALGPSRGRSQPRRNGGRGQCNAQEHQVQHNVSDDDHRAMQGRVVLTRRVQPLQNPRVAMYLQQEGEGAKHSNKLNGTRGVACPTNAPSLYAGWDLSPRFTPPLLLLSQPPLATPWACSRMARAQKGQIGSRCDAAGSHARPRRQPRHRVRPPTSPHPIRKKQPTTPIWARWHSGHDSKAGSGTNLACLSHHRGRLRALPGGQVQSLP